MRLSHTILLASLLLLALISLGVSTQLSYANQGFELLHTTNINPTELFHFLRMDVDEGARVSDIQSSMLTTETPYTAPGNRYDINGDGTVTPEDVDYFFCTYSQDRRSIWFQTPTCGGQRFSNPAKCGFPCDINGDGYITPQDGLLVISYLRGKQECGDGFIGNTSNGPEQCDDGKQCDNGNRCSVDQNYCPGGGTCRTRRCPLSSAPYCVSPVIFPGHYFCVRADNGGEYMTSETTGFSINSFDPSLFANAVPCVADNTCVGGTGNGQACRTREHCAGDEAQCRTRSNDGCSATCQNEFCGDTVVQTDEACDDGMHCQDGRECTQDRECSGIGDERCTARSGDGCSATCSAEACGDGYEDGDGRDNIPGNADDEGCDDGNTRNEDGCSSICKDEVCGDGIQQATLGEECDNATQCSDGTQCTRDAECAGKEGDVLCQPRSGDGCSDRCILEFCGDAIPQTDLGVRRSPSGTPHATLREMCDQPSDTGQHICLLSNHPRLPCQYNVCGDDVPGGYGPNKAPGGDDDEECDQGSANSDSQPNACRTNCRNPWCGDGVVDSGEQCDDGERFNGSTFPCLANCRHNVCGDGNPNFGPNGEEEYGRDGSDDIEQCDDGNSESGDGCDTSCQSEIPPTHLVFATSQTFTGNLGGVEGADQKCQAAASAAGLRGEYKAWVDINGYNNRLPYSRRDVLDVVRSSEADLVLPDRSLLGRGASRYQIQWSEYPVFLTENGDSILDDEKNLAFTGLRSSSVGDGFLSSYPFRRNCQQWTSLDAYRAVAQDLTSRMGVLATRPCETEHRLICIETTTTSRFYPKSVDEIDIRLSSGDPSVESVSSTRFNWKIPLDVRSSDINPFDYIQALSVESKSIMEYYNLNQELLRPIYYREDLESNSRNRLVLEDEKDAQGRHVYRVNNGDDHYLLSSNGTLTHRESGQTVGTIAPFFYQHPIYLIDFALDSTYDPEIRFGPMENNNAVVDIGVYYNSTSHFLIISSPRDPSLKKVLFVSRRGPAEFGRTSIIPIEGNQFTVYISEGGSYLEADIELNGSPTSMHLIPTLYNTPPSQITHTARPGYEFPGTIQLATDPDTNRTILNLSLTEYFEDTREYYGTLTTTKDGVTIIKSFKIQYSADCECNPTAPNCSNQCKVAEQGYRNGRIRKVNPDGTVRDFSVRRSGRNKSCTETCPGGVIQEGMDLLADAAICQAVNDARQPSWLRDKNLRVENVGGALGCYVDQTGVTGCNSFPFCGPPTGTYHLYASGTPVSADGASTHNYRYCVCQ